MVEKRKTATRPRSTARGDALTTPEQLFSSQLKEQERVKAPNAKTLTHRGLSALIADRLPGIAKLDVTLPADPVMQLTAQHPFDSKGLLDVYEPGRWDCSSDTIFMSPIVSTGPSVGQWEGSVVYGNFKPLTAGTFVVVGNFTGFSIAMGLSGPWGRTTELSSNNIPAAVLAQWTGGPAGVSFSLSCTGLYLGFLQSVQVFRLA
jgi:hypothetical protein